MPTMYIELNMNKSTESDAVQMKTNGCQIVKGRGDPDITSTFSPLFFSGMLIKNWSPKFKDQMYLIIKNACLPSSLY